MPATPAAPEPGPVSRARDTRVIVVGGGIAGLVAALEWARIGASVTLLEAQERLGGAIETVELDGFPVDLVADALPLGRPDVDALLDELDLRDRVESAAPLPVWLASPAAPLPAGTVLGIPANPWATDVRRIIGWGGAWRAYLDRLRPPLTIGHERSLGRLVRTRMGDRVADRLVAPTTRALYGLSPDDIDVDVAAPGLSAALTRTGSLAGAAFDLLPADPSTARATLRGGMGALPTALAARLADFEVDVRTATPALALARGRDGGWSVSTPGGAIPADVVVLATDAATTASLLAPAADGLPAAGDPALPSVRTVVTLVVDAPALDAAPRGRAVYASSAAGPALAVADATADWPWLAAAAGSGRHVLRVTLATGDAAAVAASVGAAAGPGSEASTDQVAGDVPDSATIEAALRAAEEMLGVTLGAPRAAAVRRVRTAGPASRLGHSERVAAIRAAAGGVAVVGAGVSGSGIAQVVADTIAEIDRQRSAVLWAAPAPD